MSLVHCSPSGERHRSTPKHTALLPLPPQRSRFTWSVQVPVLHSWQPLTQLTLQHTPAVHTPSRHTAPVAQESPGPANCTAAPVIFSATDCPLVASVTTRSPLRAPTAGGRNWMLSWQLRWPATLWPLQPSLTSVKSLGLLLVVCRVPVGRSPLFWIVQVESLRESVA